MQLSKTKPQVFKLVSIIEVYCKHSIYMADILKALIMTQT